MDSASTPPQTAEVAILQDVIMVVIQVSLPVLLAWGLAELKRFLGQMRKSNDWSTVEWAVSRAVAAAEQLDLTDQLAEYGEGKLDVAIKLIEAQLAAAGVPLDIDQYEQAVRAMIEAEVKRQFGDNPYSGGGVTPIGYPNDTSGNTKHG